MQLTYFQSEQLSTFDTEDSSVLLEALPGHTEQEMLSLLNHLNVDNVETICPGVLSAVLTPELIAQLQKIATVEKVTRKQILAMP